MNSLVLHFTPRDELEPTANVEGFIEACRHSGVLNSREQFDRNVWDLGHQKGHNKVLRAVFSSMEAAADDQPEPTMPEPFLSFAKAVIVYLQDSRPVVSQSVRISALRHLEAALRDLSKGSRPTGANPEVFDRAVELARGKVSAGVAYRIAGQLELIAKLMAAKHFIQLRQPWSHGLKKPQENGSRISAEAIEARKKKLPSAAALRALGGIFFEAREPADVLVSSFTALLLCAPERINEALRLRRNCIVEGDSRFAGKTGLQWAGSKGFEDTTKWLPTQMSPIAKEAVSNLLRVTSPGQEIAAWYTKHPTKMYYHQDALHLRGQDTLSLNDLALLLWGAEGNSASANTWARHRKLIAAPLDGRRIGYLRTMVEKEVLSMLPSSFPHVPGDMDLLCKDSLVVVRTNEMHSQRATYLCMFECVDYQTVDSKLGAEGRLSVFDRFDFKEDDGSSIQLNSHSLRHYLNMLAQIGGLSSSEIAIFSGRKDVKQNRAYDHMSSDEVQEPISRAIAGGFTKSLVAFGGLRDLMNRSDFKGVGAGAAHTTAYGYCVHNFAAEPCQMYRDCINCEEQECVKGDSHKEANLRRLAEETELGLRKAREALADAEYGADRWVEHQTKTLERTRALLKIMDDTTVPVGARIRLDVVSNAPLITRTPVALPITMRRDRKALK